jgi:hypothetical protein
MHNQQMQLLRNDIDNVREDNVKLYAKMKFLQNYAGRQQEVSGRVSMLTVRMHKCSKVCKSTRTPNERMRASTNKHWIHSTVSIRRTRVHASAIPLGFRYLLAEAVLRTA